MLGLACHSMPLLPRLSPAQEQWSRAFPIGKVSGHFIGCPSLRPDGAEDCAPRLRMARELVLASGVFTSFEDDPERADIVVMLIEGWERPYWSTPAHNPAFALLTLAGIPFWWTDTLGQQLLVEQRASGRAERIDMRREGTRVMWLFAPLLNVGPNRAFAPNLEREASHLRLHLLQFLAAERAPEPGADADTSRTLGAPERAGGDR